MATFGERFTGAMKLDVHTFEEVEQDTNAMGQAVGVIVIAAVAAGIGNLFINGVAGIIGGTLMALIGYLVWAGIVFLVGTKVMPEPTTKADFQETFRVLGFAAAPGVFRIFGIIPFLGWLIGFLVGIWMLVAMVVAVRQVLDYSSTGKAVVVCIIGFIAYLLFSFILIAPFMAMMR